MLELVENKQLGENLNNNKPKPKRQTKFAHLRCIIWFHRGELTPVRFISTYHIVNIIKHLKTTTDESFSGYSREEWLEAFEAELAKRDRMCLTVFSIFPVLRKMLR